MAHMQPVRATVPWRRVLCARVGVLEDVRGAAGDGPDSGPGDDGCLGTVYFAANHHEDALSVQEAELSLERRRGASKEEILEVQNNLAGAYDVMGRRVEASNMLRDVYSGRLKLHGEENIDTIAAANNYATTLLALKRFEEAKSLLRKMMAVARRVVGENHELTLRMKWNYAEALYSDDDATLGDLHEAVTTLEETERTARRVLGGAHPLTKGIERALRESRAALSARDDVSAVRGALEAMNAT